VETLFTIAWNTQGSAAMAIDGSIVLLRDYVMGVGYQ